MAEILLPTSVGMLPTYLATPASAGPWPGVVVISDAGGMRDDLRHQANWLAGAGYLAAAPNLREGGTILKCLREILFDYLTWQGTLFAQIEGVRSWLTEQEQCTGKIGVIGFCMGGSFALMLAPGHGFSASSVNYGQIPKDVERLLSGACPIVGSFGRRDSSLRGAAARLDQALTAVGVAHDVKEYPEAGHGFLNDHAPGDVPLILRVMGSFVQTAYHEPSAQDARRRIEAFFAAHKKTPSL